jgi:hypothetical protein
MKQLPIKSGILVFLFLLSCQKNEPNPISIRNEERITKQSYVENGEEQSATIYKYAGDKLIHAETPIYIDWSDTLMDTLFYDISYYTDSVVLTTICSDETFKTYNTKNILKFQNGKLVEKTGFRHNHLTWYKVIEYAYNYESDRLSSVVSKDFVLDYYSDRKEYVYDGNKLVQENDYLLIDGTKKQFKKKILNYSGNLLESSVDSSITGTGKTYPLQKITYSYIGSIRSSMLVYNWNTGIRDWMQDYDLSVKSYTYTEKGNAKETILDSWLADYSKSYVFEYESGIGNAEDVLGNKEVDAIYGNPGISALIREEMTQIIDHQKQFTN